MNIGMIKALISGQRAYLQQHLFEKDQRQIIIQEMVHIGSEKMYEDINASICEYLQTYPDAKVYLEGIYGNKADSEKLNIKMMGILGVRQSKDMNTLFLKSLYKGLAYVAGLSVQDNDNYLKNVPKASQVKADVTFGEMYEWIKDIPEATVKIDFSMEEAALELAKKLKFPGFMLRQILRATLLNKDGLDKQKGTLGMIQLQRVILQQRNEFLINKLLRARTKNVFVTYGAAHLKEVKQALIEKGFTHRVVKEIAF